MLDAVRGSVEAAKREASLTTDVLQRLEASTGRLAEAQKRADQYLANVTSVLEEAHAAFADNVERTLSTSNKAFYDSLTQATKLLQRGDRRARADAQLVESTCRCGRTSVSAHDWIRRCSRTQGAGRGREAVLDLVCGSHDGAHGVVPRRS